MKKCCICGNEIVGMGNNPYPVEKEGECCDICNLQKVIPERIMLMKHKMMEETVEQIAKQITDKITKEIIDANNTKGIVGVNEVLDKYQIVL